MTISTSASQTVIGGNGATTAFNFSFIAGSAANVQVIFTDALNNQTVLTSGYTLVLNAPAAGQIWGVGGTVTYNPSGIPIPNGTSLTIRRIVPITQTTSISNQGDFYPQVVEAALDTLCLEIQQVSARTGQLRGAWATGLTYNFGDVVTDGANGNNTGNFYMCAIQNTSGVWATDLAAGDWVLAYIGLTSPNIIAVLGYTPMRGSNNLSEITVAASARGNLGLGSISTQSAGAVAITGGTITGTTINGHSSLDLAIANNLSDLNSTATARTNLGVAIGSNVQAWSANLDTFAGKTPPAGAVIGTTDAQSLSNKTITNSTLNNSSVGATTPASGAFTTLTASTPIGFASGGVNASSLAGARASLGITSIVADFVVSANKSIIIADPTETNVIHADEANAIILGGTNSNIGSTGSVGSCDVIIGGFNNTMPSTNGDNAIIGGFRNIISQGFSDVTDSFIAGGSQNIVNGDNSGIIAGSSNVITSNATQSFVGGGSSHNVDDRWCGIIGGDAHSMANGCQAAAIAGGFSNSVTTNGQSSFIAAGQGNVADSDAACLSGYLGKSWLSTQRVLASGQNTAVGDASLSEVVVFAKTLNNTQTELQIGGTGANQHIVIPNDTTIMFSVNIAARRTDADNESAAFTIVGCIDNNANTVALVGSVTTVVVARDDAAWTVTAQADNTNKSLNILVTGEAAKTILWVAGVTLIKATG